MHLEQEQTLKNIEELLGALQTQLLKLTGKDLYELFYKLHTSEENIEQKCSLLFHKLGIQNNLSGYDYLMYTIVWLSQQKNPKDIPITKQLYPLVAKKFGKTTTIIERGIRHAIEVVLTSGNTNLLNELLGYSMYTGKISNSFFIFRLLEYVQKGY